MKCWASNSILSVIDSVSLLINDFVIINDSLGFIANFSAESTAKRSNSSLSQIWLINLYCFFKVDL